VERPPRSEDTVLTWRDFRAFWCGLSGADIWGGPPTPPPEPEPELPTDKAEIRAAATRLLGDPAFVLAMQRVEDRLYESWKLSAPGDYGAREEHYRLYWAVGELRSELRRMTTS